MNEPTKPAHVPDGPSFQPWLDIPTLRLDDAGKLAAARHIREGRIDSRSRFRSSDS